MSQLVFEEIVAEVMKELSRAGITLSPGQIQALATSQFKTEPPSPLSTETKFGEMEAFRVWSWNGEILESVFMNMPWAPKQIMQSRNMVRVRRRFTTENELECSFLSSFNVEFDFEVKDSNPPKDYGQDGIHGWENVGELISYIESYKRFCDPIHRDSRVRKIIQSPMVIGRIKMWGDVIHHERGFRAEFAKISHIDGVYVESGPNSNGNVWKEHRSFSLLQQIRNLYFPESEKK